MKTNPSSGMSQDGSLLRFPRGFALLLLISLSLPAAGLAAPGDLDPSFDGDGRVLTDFGGFDRPFTVVRQPDGKLVAAGASFIDGSDDFSLARYNPDGGLDVGFGVQGRVLTDLGGNDGVFALVVQPDGKVVAAGFSRSAGGLAFALARYRPDGSLDTGFGTGGIVLDVVGGFAFSTGLVLQPDGKLVAAGTSVSPDPRGIVDVALARYNPDGTLDTSFGTGGHAFLLLRSVDSAFSLAIQPDGKLVTAGFAFLLLPNGTRSPADFLVARFNGDGSLDSFVPISFTPTSDDIPFKVAVQSDLKLIVAGQSDANGDDDLALVRLNPDLGVDTDFGDLGGRQVVDLGGDDIARDLVVQPDGKVAVAGFSFIGEEFDFVLARFNSDGSSDTGFGAGGVTRTAFGGPSIEGAFGLALQPDGRLVAAGTSNAGGDLDFALARFEVTDARLPPLAFCDGRPVTIMGTPGNDNLRGTAGNDVIHGLRGDDTIRGLGGNDILCGGKGDDVLIGGPGRDRVFGQGGRDQLFGKAGADTIRGGGDRDRCNGGPGRNSIDCEGGPRPRPPQPQLPAEQPPPGVCNTPLCLPALL
jgi:uncharacterized delta-60 repeat protein